MSCDTQFHQQLPESERLRISICGKLSVEAGRFVLVEHDFPARQGRRLWCYLVLERHRWVSRDEVADALWGDDAPDEWDTTLSAVASRLRSSLKPVGSFWTIEVRSDAGGFQLQLPVSTFIDFERARFGLHLAETALAQGDIARSLAEARVSLEIAARGFLPGDRLPWIQLRRRQLRDIQIHANECLAEGELRRDQPLRAEREAEHLLTIDPLNETGYRIRMRSAALLGNRAGVLRAMEQCRSLLHDFADLSPSVETERLFRALIDPEDIVNG